MSDHGKPTATEDLLDSSQWRPLRLLLDSMDRDIASLYADAGITGLRTRYVGPLIQLSRRDAMTIQELAASVEVTHSAMSQTAAAMRRAGLVDEAHNDDGRTRRVRLSAKGRDLVPFLQAEWRATETAVRELDAEIPYPLNRVVTDIEAALARRPFKQRLTSALASALATAPATADRR